MSTQKLQSKSLDTRISSACRMSTAKAVVRRGLFLRRQLPAVAGFEMPDLGSILLDGAVGGELAGARDVKDGHPVPDVGRSIGSVNALLRLDVVAHIR